MSETKAITIDTHELAWAAGFFDGEGSFMFICGKRKELAMTISQCDRRPLERFHQAIGQIGTIRGPYRTYPKYKKYKPIWVVGTHGFKDTQAVIALLWRWLCEPKREQATKALVEAAPHYLKRYEMGRGSAKLTRKQAIQLRFEHSQARIGRQRVPKGWISQTAARYGIKEDTVSSICQGYGYDGSKARASS